VTSRPIPDPSGYRCGCGKNAHSNLTPCQPDPPYTEDDLRAEAARQHASLTADPDFIGVSEMMEGEVIPSTMTDIGFVEGEQYELCQGWHQLAPEHFEAAHRSVSDLLDKVINVSEYAIDCGAEGLVPTEHRLVRGVETGVVCAAFHISLDPHLELDQRAYDEIADIVRNNLAFREEGNHKEEA
jgi:hypothetical protein